MYGEVNDSHFFQKESLAIDQPLYDDSAASTFRPRYGEGMLTKALAERKEQIAYELTLTHRLFALPINQYCSNMPLMLATDEF